MTKTVAVIGAGIVGVSTAIWLQRHGHRVILIDRAGPGEGASHGNGGVLASCAVVPVPGPGMWRSAPRMLLDPNQPLFVKWSYLPKMAPWLMRFLSQANAAAVRRRAAAIRPIIGDSYNDHLALATGTGAERWLHPADYLHLYTDRAAFDADAFGFSVKRENGFDWELLEGQALRDYDPAFSPALSCAARFPGHGRISDPGRYVKDLAGFAEAQGARLITGAVSDVVQQGGTVSGVRIGGETLACEAVVLTAGAWSGPLAAQLGVMPPLESERGYHLELYKPSVMPRAPVMVAGGKFVATPMEGRLRLAGIVELGGLELPASEAPFALLERQIRAAMPGLRWAKTVRWMGHRPSMADSLPVIGEAPALKGAYMGFGHDHVGLTGGPKTGRLLAQLISGRTPDTDLAPYAPDRFR